MSSDTPRATRRNGVPTSAGSSSVLQQQKDHLSSTIPTTYLSALKPTTHELLLFSIPFLTLSLGSLFSLLSPLSPPASSYHHPLSTSATSPTPQPVPPPTYFAQKHNLLNILFVKRGWFWASVALLTLISTHPAFGPPLRPVVTPRRLRAALRWALLTAWWALVTRPVLGPSLIDRVFLLTGGVCALEQARAEEGQMGKIEGVLSAHACKAAGGWWAGGWDVSGHVFLMVLVVVFLGMETLPVVLARETGRKVVDGKGRVLQAEMERIGNAPEADESGTWGIRTVLVVVGLAWWMLFMTAIYFHTWIEKVLGLALALTAIFAVYFTPRLSPTVRTVVGVPGI